MTGTVPGDARRRRDHGDCGVAEELIERVLDGECSAELVETVERHLDTCEQCRARVENVRVLKQAVRSACWGEVAPETVRARVAELHVSWRATVVRRSDP